MPMRRADREVTDFGRIIEIMQQCDVCRLAINDGDYPYIIPMNFGMNVNDDKIKLYFHSATEGTKLELIAKNPHVSFEMDRAHRLMLIEDGKNCTMEYESVIGRGTARIVSDNEKFDALSAIMHHYRADSFGVNEAAIPRTTVIELTVESMTSKERKVRK